MKKAADALIFILLAVLSIVFLLPIVIVLMNSFKSKFFISQQPFIPPDSETFAGLEN